jgi:DNA mismatch repair protein MutS
MMEQYLRLKAAHPDAILFFHLGDFYEAFFEDAAVLARELDVVLTARNGHPMAGVPVRRGEVYVNRLLKRGYKVAVCQQVEDPRQAIGLVRREVVRVVTPGTTLDDGVLEAGENNYLVAVYPRGGRYGIAALDLSTGELAATEAADRKELAGELGRLAPSEILVPQGREEDVPSSADRAAVSVLDEGAFSAKGVAAPDLGVPEAALAAAGAILFYVQETQKDAASHIRPLAYYGLSGRMELDPFTVRSLELVKPLYEGKEAGTLLHVLDHCATSMGRRRLRRALLAPLTDRPAIEGRLDAVEALAQDELLVQEVTASLREVHDLERLTGKLGARRMSPLELLALQRTLAKIPGIAETLDRGSSGAPAGGPRPSLLQGVLDCLRDARLPPLAKTLDGMLVDQPPPDPAEGGLIRPGFDAELDRLRGEVRALREAIAAFEATERERSEIPSLKIGYNRVFGYYLEVTRTHLAKVPPHYRRRQTLASAERFTTDELRGYEERIVHAEERSKALEVELFRRTVDRLVGEIPLLQRASDALSELDFLLSLAVAARRNRYHRPRFVEEHALRVRRGRHPVVEQGVEFVPNDLDLPSGKDLVILTGPNMSGKSVYLRQVALIALMAQTGSFVPAEEAILPLVDRVFARVGASDRLSDGVSTFMMEMLEVATIVERATSRSLIILDEVGRGTSTFDGVSIAWAIAKELATRLKAKTLFATHYQELTRLADEVPSVVNLHVAAKQVGKEVVFLHRVEPGVAERSYGVHVARLAGLPARVTEAADRILERLLAEAPLSSVGETQAAAEPLPLFGAEDHPVVKELRAVDPNRLTPLEALELLARLKERL